jgi:hypothetical protein
MSAPTSDDLASVLASVISTDRTTEDILERTGIASETAAAAIAELMRRRLLRQLGGGRYHVTQSLCAGACSRGGRGLLGHEVVINRQTLRWMCSSCWDASEHPRPNGADDLR